MFDSLFTFGTAKPGTLLKSQVPIRTFSDWDDDRTGFLEADFVAHTNITQPIMSRHSTTHPFVSQRARINSTGSDLEPVERMYRQTRRRRRMDQCSRWWRTRIDPFAEVWEEIDRGLEHAPYTNAKTLIQKIQEKPPGRFSEVSCEPSNGM